MNIYPAQKKATILQLVEEFYEEKVYTNNEQIVSLTFSDFKITIEQLSNVWYFFKQID